MHPTIPPRNDRRKDRAQESHRDNKHQGGSPESLPAMFEYLNILLHLLAFGLVY